MNRKSELHLHLISDSTGETVHQYARAGLAQFPETTIKEHIWTLVRNKAHIDAIDRNLEKNPGVVLFSVVNEEVREMLEVLCTKKGVPNLSSSCIVEMLFCQTRFEGYFSNFCSQVFVEIMFSKCLFQID